MKKLLMIIFMVCVMAVPALAWWDNSYTLVEKLNLTNADDTNATNYPICVTLDTTSGYQADCDDIRVVYQETDLVNWTNRTACNDASTEVCFKVNIPANSYTEDYEIYHNNTGATDVRVTEQQVFGIEPDADTVFYLPMNENIGTNTTSQGTNTMTFTFYKSPAWFSGSSCKLGACIDFDLGNEGAQISGDLIYGTPLAIPLGNGLTYSTWVYVNSFTTWYNTFSNSGYQQDNTPAGSLNIRIAQTGEPSIILGDGSTTHVSTANTSLSTGAWHHIAVTWAGTGTIAQWYLDGEPAGGSVITASGVTATSTARDWVIGSSSGVYGDGGAGYAGRHSLDGVLDEFIYYNRSLDEAEVKTLALGFDTTETITASYEYCEADWTCSLYGDCNTSDLRPCIAVEDANNCEAQGFDYTYSGDYSEFSPQACDYCTPDFYCANYQGECPPDKTKDCIAVDDTNDCYETTGLASDDFNGTLADYEIGCGFNSVYTSQDLRDITVDFIGSAGAEILAVTGLLVTVAVVGLLVGRLGGMI